MKCVLLVDDNINDRAILRYNFGWYGYDSLEAANGLEGLKLARAEHPDLIVSDALMPVLDGFRLLQAVKADPELREIPFIFYSSIYTGKQEEQLALKMGALAFIAKPKGREEFWAEVSRALVSSPEVLFRPTPPPLDQRRFIEEYSQVVALKLEEKVRELEEANRKLREGEE